MSVKENGKDKNMFSSMIQNLLSSGGQAQAAQRYVELNRYVDNFNKQIKAQNTSELQQNMQSTNNIDGVPSYNGPSFDNVLKASAKTPFGSLLTGKALNVNAQKVEASDTVSPAINMDAPSKNQILNLVTSVSKKHGVDDKLVKALIKQESGFNPKAKSHAGAMGLMQLMPSTAKGLGVTDPMNPVQNVEGGVKYLKSMLDRYNGNIILALAAYNAGPGAVDRYSGVPPYKETQNYVKNILSDYL